MRRLIRWIVLLAAVGGLAVAGSYVGARAAAGKFLGAEPPLMGREVALQLGGVEDLEGNPRAWVFTYTQSRLPNVRSAVIYVSLTGKIIETRPRNLDLILDTWEAAQEP
jgi:hypothetical protein